MPKYSVSLDNIQAFIFDLDGVLTSTARLHTIAWKKTFDNYLKDTRGKKFRPFRESDYRKYVDGKPRYDGANDFLKSRGVSIPWGNKEDPESRESVCGLGNKKDKLYLRLLRSEGAIPFRPTVDFIKDLRSRYVRTAIFSSSRNCREVLKATGTSHLFDAKVDGIDLERLKIAGKPDPAMLIEAARRVGARPDETVIVEDSLAGVEAGNRGKFALVIGIIRSRGGTKLKEHGADIAISDLGNLVLREDEDGFSSRKPRDKGPYPALRSKRIFREITARSPVIFLDYDGTLTKIVKDPTKAKITKETRRVIKDLSSLCKVAILSGRDVKDIMKLVKVPRIVYAGSHGFDIVMENGRRKKNARWDSFLPSLDQAEEQLRMDTKEIEGALVERKKFAISLHYRNVPAEEVKKVKKAFNLTASSYSKRLRRSEGKKVYELLPKVKWNKGRALQFLMKSLKLGGEVHKQEVPVFLGDDVTDEDGFKVLRNDGIGIIVSEKKSNLETYAKYSLKNPGEAKEFLKRVVSVLARKEYAERRLER